MQSWTASAGGDTHTRPSTAAPDTHTRPSTTPPALANAAAFYRSTPVLDRRIHILGVGNVGSFVAHAVRGVPNPPPVTLLFPSWDRLAAWSDSPQRLALVTDGDTELRDGFDAELAIPRLRFHGSEVGLSATSVEEPHALDGESTAPISSLVVCSKAPVVLQGLSAVKHRLRPDSVVLFMQNGMGVVDEVSRHIFPDPATRPYYMLAVNSHGLHSSPDAPFTTVHAGFGTLSLGIVPHERDRDPNAPYAPRHRNPDAPNALRHRNPDAPNALRHTTTPHKHAVQHSPPPPGSQEDDVALPASAHVPWTPNQRYLLRTLLRSPVLAATAFSPPDLLQMQLEKLAVNCILNPLTVLLDARNGSILYNYALTRTMRLLLAEISLVLRSLPELQYIPNVDSRFDPGRLETIVVSVAQKTKDNVSSMLADARAGRQTEIDYINGWVVRRGEDLGIRCVMNYLLTNLVKGKAQMIDLEIGDGVPFVGPAQPGKDGLELRRDVAKSAENSAENSDQSAENSDQSAEDSNKSAEDSNKSAEDSNKSAEDSNKSAENNTKSTEK